MPPYGHLWARLLLLPPIPPQQTRIFKAVSYTHLLMRITTDSTPVEDPKPTEGSVILQLYKLFASAQGYEDMVLSLIHICPQVHQRK